MAPDYLSFGGSIGSNAIGRIVGETPKLTKGSSGDIVSDDCKKFPAAVFSPPHCGGAYLTTAAIDANRPLHAG
jgi:hypothetical protein